MAILFVIGRILFGGYFLYSGFNHLLEHDMMSGYAKSKGVPFPKLAVIVSGLFIIFGGLGVLLWIYVSWALALIIVFLLVVSLTMHNFWTDRDSATKMVNLINFNKNLALIGAALIMLMLR